MFKSIFVEALFVTNIDEEKRHNFRLKETRKCDTVMFVLQNVLIFKSLYETAVMYSFVMKTV